MGYNLCLEMRLNGSADGRFTDSATYSMTGITSVRLGPELIFIPMTGNIDIRRAELHKRLYRGYEFLFTDTF
jgi:hypothetical protein